MRIVTAVIRPALLDEVKEALTEIDVQGLTVVEARGFGRQRGHSEVYRGAEYQVEFVPKVKVEVLVGEDLAQTVAQTIMRVARTGKIGDGKIWISPIDTVIRIRTAETGEEAL